VHGFSGPFGLKWFFWWLGQNKEEWCDIDPNELVFTFGVFYVCVNFGEN